MDKKSFGVFRRCQFADGKNAWIVALLTEHREGELVAIGKRDGSLTHVVLGQRVPALVGRLELPFCHLIGPLVAAPCHHAPRVLPDARPWLQNSQPITQMVQ